MTEQREPSAPHNIEPHSNVAKMFHWGFLAFFVFALSKQIDEVEELEDLALLEYEMIFATIFLIVVLIRLIYMQVTRPTALPDATPIKMKRLARLVHLSMYFSLSMIAITGLAIGHLYGSGTKSGDTMDLVLILHELAVITTYWLIFFHVSAAVYHRWKGDGIWNSMVPFLRETPKT